MPDPTEDEVMAVAKAMRPKWFPKDKIYRPGSYEDNLQNVVIADARAAITALDQHRAKKKENG